MRAIVVAVLTVIVAIMLIAAFATTSIADEKTARQETQASYPTSTYIPAPKVGLFRCVWDVDGFSCVEVVAAEVCR